MGLSSFNKVLHFYEIIAKLGFTILRQKVDLFDEARTFNVQSGIVIGSQYYDKIERNLLLSHSARNIMKML